MPETRVGAPRYVPDVMVAVAAIAARAALDGGRRAHRATRPLGRGVTGVVRALPAQRSARGWLEAVAARGAADRALLASRWSRVLDLLVPLFVRELLDRVDLTETVRQNVDLNSLLDGVDLDAAASRLDVDQVASRLDLAAVVRRIDLDAVVRRIDLDAAMDRIDITAVVLERVDLDAIVGRVLDHLDLAALTQQVLEAVDMPEVIRGSSGAMASDTVREIRMQGVAGDQAVRRAVDRLLGHRRPVQAPG